MLEISICYVAFGKSQDAAMYWHTQGTEGEAQGTALNVKRMKISVAEKEADHRHYEAGKIITKELAKGL